MYVPRVYGYLCVCVYVYMCVCAYVYMCVCVYVCIFASVHVCVSVCISSDPSNQEHIKEMRAMLLAK